ncbi:DUF6250 domain-containing protein [Ideonella sp.]|uniref:DUF6250 domain-containing protein n=1 Tax=Ideonella sp. TaxID=1929293 RepID=UPI002D7EFE97|nr:DUF6250 domain-containing protein [Ideonella sp.]
MSAPRMLVSACCLAVGLLQGCGGSDDDEVLARDDFTHGTSQWQVEQQDATGTVVAKDGVLDMVQPAGATIWFKQQFSGNHEIRFTATPIPVTFPGTAYVDRISDLNVFWDATVPTGSDPDPTAAGLDGVLASYNALHLYYVGFGANGNTSTRLRRYDGTSARPQITGYATPASATVDDKAGAMTAATSLTANTPVAVRIVSRQPTAADPANLKWYANGQLIFSYSDASPYLSGWFAFRTTTSHWQLRDFSVVALPTD